jgi:threonine dehydrogenase-like Zn-dependent dehydrogenase
MGVWPTGAMQAVMLSAPGIASCVEVKIPVWQPNCALVAVTRVGLCGSDLELLDGSSSYLQTGRARYPLIPGHEWVGVIVAVDGSTRLTPGQRVVGKTMLTCKQCEACASGRENECVDLREVGLYSQDGAAARYIRVPTSSLVPVPDSVSDRQAALVEPTVTILEALGQVDIRPGAQVAVVGPGTLGLLAAKVLVRYPVELSVFGVTTASLRASKRLGATTAEVFAAHRDGGRYDVAIEASGTVQGFRDAQDALRVGGAMIAVGVPHGVIDGFEVGRFVLAGQRQIGVRHGMNHYWEALRLFELGMLDEGDLLDSELPLELAAEAFTRLADPGRTAPKVSLIIQDEERRVP